MAMRQKRSVLSKAACAVLVICSQLMIIPLLAQAEIRPAEKLDLPPIEPAKFDKIFPPPPKNLKFPQIVGFDAVLEKVSPEVEFKAGTLPDITFRLQNRGLKNLVIPEWMMQEELNISIYYTPWELGQEIPALEAWKEQRPDIGENPRRMTLALKHRNSVLVKTQMDFVKDMNIVTPQDFLLIARLNLSSILIRTRVMRVRVNP